MYKINGLTEDPKQHATISLFNGKTMDMSLEYKPMQTGWFISFTYGDFSVTNLRLVTSPNLLHQFKNLIPFGIAVEVDNDQEPLLVQDFFTGRASLYIIDTTEVAAFEAFLGE